MNLFGEDEPRQPTERKPHPLTPWYDAIGELIGPAAAKSAAGRVLKIAKQMKSFGLTPERLKAALPGVVAKYAGWRKVIDLAAVQECWPWIITPPTATPARPSRSALDVAAARTQNGGADPF